MHCADVQLVDVPDGRHAAARPLRLALPPVKLVRSQRLFFRPGRGIHSVKQHHDHVEQLCLAATSADFTLRLALSASCDSFDGRAPVAWDRARQTAVRQGGKVVHICQAA
jgi:hypothetical protein